MNEGMKFARHRAGANTEHRGVPKEERAASFTWEAGSGQVFQDECLLAKGAEGTGLEGISPLGPADKGPEEDTERVLSAGAVITHHTTCSCWRGLLFSRESL